MGAEGRVLLAGGSPLSLERSNLTEAVNLLLPERRFICIFGNFLLDSNVGFFRDNLNGSVFKKIFFCVVKLTMGGKTEDQMKTVGRSCDFAFSSGSSGFGLLSH